MNKPIFQFKLIRLPRVILQARNQQDSNVLILTDLIDSYWYLLISKIQNQNLHKEKKLHYHIRCES